MNTSANRLFFQVVVAAIASLNEQHCPSSLRNMLSSLLRDVVICCLFSSVIFPFLTDTGFAQSRGRIVANSFRTDVVANLKQVMNTSFVVMASYVTV